MCANHSEWKLDAHPLSSFSAGTHERYCGHLPKFVTMVAPQTHESGVTSVTNIRYIHLSLIHIEALHSYSNGLVASLLECHKVQSCIL